LLILYTDWRYTGYPSTTPYGYVIRRNVHHGQSVRTCTFSNVYQLCFGNLVA